MARAVTPATGETTWNTGTIPARTGLLIFVPFFDRDGEPFADADHFALLVASTMLAARGRDRAWRLLGRARLDAGRPLPATLTNYALRLTRRAL